jgi:hypothetical protein
MQLDYVKVLSISAMLVIAWAWYRDRNAKALTKAAKAAAMEKFRKVAVSSEDSRLHFDGATAKVLKLEETGVIWNPSSGTYTLAVWAENHCGNVFHVRVSADQVFVKQVPENAQQGVPLWSTPGRR